MLFGNSRVLWLLLVFPPAMLAFFWWSARVRQQLMTQFIQTRLLSGLTIGISPARQRLGQAFLVLAVIFLILALARPHWGFDWEETKQRGLDIVVAIDTSKSMMAEDIAPNRLARAKLAALDLMQQAKSDRLGLVAFAGNAFLQCPLTVDDSAFRQSVEALDVNIIPQGGTAIAEAIDAALTAFKEGDNYKILVLFTDGEDHDSGALEQAKKAAEAGLRIYTIGVGTVEGEPLRLKDASGRTDYIRDEQGNMVKSHLNESLLQDIARATEGGFYLPLRGAKTIDMLYQQALAKLPKSQHESKLMKRYHERYHWPLGLALLLLMAEMLLPERKRESRAETSTTRQGAPRRLASVTAAVLVLFLPAVVALGSPSSALREYKAGKYDEALKEYEQLLKRKSDDPRLHFNAGASAYQSQQFDEAAKQFNEALSTPDLNLQGRSYYNRGNTLFHLGEKANDPAKRTEAWEKSIKDFESSLKLNPKDNDAQFNRDFVKKKLEEFKQQQQQQQKSDQDKSDQKQDQNQDQQQQQGQQNKNDPSQKDQQKQQQSQAKQDQSDQKKNQEQKQNQQANKPEEQKEQQQQAAQQKEDKEKQDQQSAQQAAVEQKEKGDENEQQEAAATAAGEMTPQQARQLLDAQKSQEQILPPNPKEKLNNRSRTFKDW